MIERKRKSILEEALGYAADLTYAMPVEGLALEDGRVVEPNLNLVWEALTQQYRIETHLAELREATEFTLAMFDQPDLPGPFKEAAVRLRDALKATQSSVEPVR